MPNKRDETILILVKAFDKWIATLTKRRAQLLKGLTGKWVVRKRWIKDQEGITVSVKADHCEYLGVWGAFYDSPEKAFLLNHAAGLKTDRDQYMSTDFVVYEIVEVNTGEVFDG